MKNLLSITLLVIGITSCSTDAIEPSHNEFYTIKKSEILVTVTRLDYNSGQCGNGCGTGSETVAYVSDSKIKIYHGAVTDTDQAGSPLLDGKTDSNGRWIATELEPGQYTVMAQTQYGIKYRALYTQLSRRSSIEFSFCFCFFEKSKVRSLYRVRTFSFHPRSH